MSYEHVKSFEPGFIKRQLDQVEESIAQWPLWMRREAGLLPPCKHRWNKPNLRFARFCVRCGTKWAEVQR